MYQSQVSGFSILKNEIGQYFDFGHNMGIENIRITHLPTIENAALKIRADGQYATYPSGRLPSDDESMYPFLRRAIEKKDLVLLKRLLTGADPAFSKEMYGLMPGNEVIQTAIPQNESLSDDDLGKRYLLFRMALVNKPAEAFKYIPETMNQAMFVAFLGIALDSPNNVKMMEYLTVKPEFADLVSAIINLDRKDATIDDRIYAVDFDPIVIDNLQKSLIAACESERNNENAIKTFVRKFSEISKTLTHRDAIKPKKTNTVKDLISGIADEPDLTFWQYILKQTFLTGTPQNFAALIDYLPVGESSDFLKSSITKGKDASEDFREKLNALNKRTISLS